MSSTVVVITGAAELDPRAVAAVPDDAVLIAADGGLDHARAAGLEPSVLVGDLDSVSASGLAWASEHTTVVRHPVDKAATDTELAIAHAASLTPERILLVAGAGDRLDHAVAALGALGAAAVGGVAHLEAWWGVGPVRRRSRSRVDHARPPDRHDVLRARDARRRRGRDGAGSPLAAAGPSPRAARRPRRQQPGPRATCVGVGAVRRRHDRRSRRGVMTGRMRLVGGLLLTLGAVASCGDDGGADSVTLVTYDSFPAEGTPLNDALAAFTEETGIAVELLAAGDTGTMVSKAVLTAGNPEGDVMFGIDNTFLSRVVDEDVIEPYEAAGLDAVPAELRQLVPEGEATPVDFGDVCVNYDAAWFGEHGLEPPGRPAGADRPRIPRSARGGEPSHVVARAGLPHGDRGRVRGRRVDRLLDGADATTASRSSTTGSRRTTSGSPVPATATARSSSATARAHPPRWCSPTRRSTSRPPASSSRRASAKSSSPPCCAAPTRLTRRASWSTSSSRRRSRSRSRSTCSCIPANGDVALPEVMTDFADRAARSAHARPGDDRRQPRGLDRRVDRPRSAVAPNRVPAWLVAALLAIPIVFLVVFYAWPFITLLARGLTPATIEATFSRPSTWHVVWFTLWQAVASTVLTVIVGLLPAYVLSRFRFRGRRLLAGLLTAAFVLPTVVMGAAVLALLPAGWERGIASHPRRPRDVQSRRRRAHRWRGVAAPVARPRGGGRHAGRVPVAGRSARSRCRSCGRPSSPARPSSSSSRSRRSGSFACSATPARRPSRSRSGVAPPSSATSAPRRRWPSCSSC